MKSIRLGIVIVSWNVRELLDQCLASLYTACNNKLTQQVCTQKPQVIVVDNASADGSVEMVQNQHPWVRLIASHENLGYVKANNIAIQALNDGSKQRPDAIWLLNPDTLVHDNTIFELLSFMISHPKAGLVGPRLLNPDSSLQESAFRFPGLLQPMFDFGLLPQRLYFTTLNGRYTQKLYASQSPFRVDHPLGAGMMASTKALDEIGLLDEKFFMYCEEIDLAWRMKNGGWECWLIPRAFLTHYSGASTRQVKPEATALLWESRARLYRKHRSRILFIIVSLMVKQHFSSQRVFSPAWDRTYKRILSAWVTHPEQLPEGKYS